MKKETLRYQRLAGIITEGEYKAKLLLKESNGYEEQAVADANAILKGEAYPNDVTTFDEALEELYMIYSSYKASPKSFFLQDKSTPKKIDAWFAKYDSLINQLPESKESLKELGGGMSPKRVFRRAIVTKLNKYYNSVDDEEFKQKLKDKFNPTIDGILYNRYGDDINNTPMVDLLADLDDYLKGIIQPEIDQYMSKK
jgi:hypothetical protein